MHPPCSRPLHNSLFGLSSVAWESNCTLETLHLLVHGVVTTMNAFDRHVYTCSHFPAGKMASSAQSFFLKHQGTSYYGKDKCHGSFGKVTDLSDRSPECLYSVKPPCRSTDSSKVSESQHMGPAFLVTKARGSQPMRFGDRSVRA